MSEQKNTAPVTDEIAVVSKDIDIFTGYLGRLENPDPTLISEANGKGLKLYDEVDRDPHAGSVLQTRYLAVAGLDWEVLPADESAKAKEIAGFVTEALDAANLKQVLQELLQAILYGYYPAEIMWSARNDGKWVPIKLIGKHPRRFCFTTERELRMLTPDNMMQGEQLPERKFINFTYGSSDNPYGKGLGQKLWWPVWFKKNGIKFWLIFLDKWGSPTAVGKYKSGADPTAKKTLLEAIEAIRQETGVTIPEDMAIELLEAKRSGNVTHESLCEYMDRQISKAVLGQTLTTEVGTNGSFAASKTHDEVRGDIKEADAGLICECLNASLIPWLVDYNFFGTNLYPEFKLRTEEKEDLKVRAETDSIIIHDIGLPVSEDYFYDTYGYPRPDPGSTLIKPQQNQPSPAFSELGSSGADKSKKYTPEQQALEGLADLALNTTDLSDNEKVILEAVQASASFEEAMDKLLEIYPDLDMTGLQDMMERVSVNAELYGRMAAHDGR